MRSITWAVLAGFIMGAAGRAQTPPVDPAPRVLELIQSYVETKVAYKQFMGSVLVAQGDKILLDQGFGYADVAQKISNTSDTKFRIGSITKQFTAAGILLLQERGKLSTGDAVKKYIPDAPEAWGKITLYNLLTHTSGLPEYIELPDFPVISQKPVTRLELIARFKDKPLEFEPGKKFAYRNSNYAVLGYILERVSGMSYAEFLRPARNVLDRRRRQCGSGWNGTGL
jgi:CubicO group peptidase (beta-lactamase class C family)